MWGSDLEKCEKLCKNGRFSGLICDPFWHNESEVAESRTEIWASEVGIGSKNGKRLF